MNLRVRFLRRLPRSFLRGWVLDRLFPLSVEAFGRPAPKTGGMKPEEKLRAFALYTAQEAERGLAEGDLAAERIRDRLFQGTRELGKELGRRLGIRGPQAAVELCGDLYAWLGIDAECQGEDGIVIGGCYFDRFYSAEVCRVMSAMDAGIAAGLAGGGMLRFSERRTEGAACCRARFIQEDEGP